MDRRGTEEAATEHHGTGTRRRFLAAMSVASTAALAGCPGGSDSPNETETGTPPPESTGTATNTPTPQDVAAVRLPATTLGEFELAVVGFEQVTLSVKGGDGEGA